MIGEKIIKVRESIQKACGKVGRDFRDVLLVCVTKGVAVERVKEVLKYGVNDIGENKVQEALIKYRNIGMNATWHMIGHLQSNKVPDAVEIFSLIHSLDSMRLARAIDRQARKRDKIQNVLVQVNISGEDSKYGIRPRDTVDFVREASSFSGLRILGLMGMARLCSDPDETRPSFQELHRIFTALKEASLENIEMKYLPMGMSQDFEVALEEGANLVRIGSAIFKESS